jgi:hypothetical protein
MWRQQRLVDDRDYDRLARPARSMLEPYPWHELSRRFPWETILLRLGGWLVVVASVLWAFFYWERLSKTERVLAQAAPILAISGVGWAIRARGSRINALVLLSIGALLVPLLVSVLLSELRWLEFWQGRQRELFAETPQVDDADVGQETGPHRIADGRGASVLSPSNLQLTVAMGVFVAYCVVLVLATRSPIMVAWVCIGVYLFYTGLLLRFGLKEWVASEHVARALVWYMLIPLAFWVVATVLRDHSGHVAYAAVAFSFLPVPLVACRGGTGRSSGSEPTPSGTTR